MTFFVANAPAAVLYVNLNSTTPASPYTNWNTAATHIQDAINAATNGDTVLVADGNYSVGNTNIGGADRVALNKAIMVQSMNGPATTTIRGQFANPAIRCAFVGSGATLSGFTLTGGRGVLFGGGALCDSDTSILTNCVLTGNIALEGGGGVSGGTVFNCIISGNSESGDGTIFGYGGGAFGSTMYNCTLSGNYAGFVGGGAASCILNNCLIAGNRIAPYPNYGAGGGADWCTLNNCTVVGNTVYSPSFGAGVSYSTVNNSIVYFNNPDNVADFSTVNNSCTTPLDAGPGNIADDPLFVNGDSHLQTNSPCINSGDNTLVATATDLDGNSRIVGNYVDIGCYEVQAAGPPVAVVHVNYTNLLTGFAASFNASLSWGLAASATWDFGDGTIVSNNLAPMHAWTSVGDYPVVAQIYAPNNPIGLSATVTVHVSSKILYYVDAGNTNPVPPYSSWQTAATNIQDAVDVATPAQGSLVLVTNGIYQFGGQVVYGAVTNRVAVTKPITVQSVNGPTASVIQGYQVSGSICGDSAVRCVYLTNNASLIGFTLMGGATRSVGDSDQEQSGGGIWCASTNVMVTNCVLVGNNARWAGGAARGGTLNNCTIRENRAEYNAGGGAESCNLKYCVLINNSSGLNGGGADQCNLYNCEVSQNSASANGGGANSSRLINCTLAMNSAGASGGGSYVSLLTNCIVYYNDAPDGMNYMGGSLNYCCALPLAGGAGNVDLEPQLIDNDHISSDSPCRGAGSSGSTTGTDIDGEPWLKPPSIGCDEFYAAPNNGSLNIAIHVGYTNVAAGLSQQFIGIIDGRADLSVWDFGDGILLTNRPSVSWSWSMAGTYPVTITAYNDSYPGGVSAMIAVNVVSQPIHFVSLASTNPIAPYLSWDTAATNIQDAIDAAFGGATVFVSNGVYRTGGRVMFGFLTNRVAVNKRMTVQSVNGAGCTIIQGNAVRGDAAVRCVYLTNNAKLIGFTLTNGATRSAGDVIKEQSGGGVWSEFTNCVLLDCVITSNSAAQSGGGAYLASRCKTG